MKIYDKQLVKEKHQHRFAKLKVLLAEDNEVNQLLAKGMMQYWGAESKVAVTGFEVLTLLQNEDFDLILMDIQMPEKSGIEATHEIRKLHDEKKKRIPIIALTANALKGEEKKYMAVGMDDFLTKPFKENELYEVVERVLGKDEHLNIKQSNNQPAVQEKDQNKMNQKLYDFDQLEEIADGNPDFLVSLAEIYMNTIPCTSTEMVKAAQRKDWMTVSKLAHKLKSTIDSMNMQTIQTEIRMLELDAKNKVNTDGLGQLAVRVDKVIQTVAEQLKMEFELC